MNPPKPNIDPSSSPPTKWEALRMSALASALFLVVYGSCNWITSLRATPSIIQFDWEKHIPVVPWMILPYMSIDLFFVAAPFLFRGCGELRTLIGRMCAAPLIAGICFLLFPLTLADGRPEMNGIFGVIHDFLKSGDKPFNLFPSLHVAYLLILWPNYCRHLRGILRALLHVWFALVLVSILFVKQHHFIDMVGGAILAVTCCYIVPAHRVESDRNRFMLRRSIAVRYFLGAAMCYVLAVITWRWGFIFAAIAVSLVIMGCGYAFAGPRIYRKHDGRIPIATRLLLAPHMLGLIATRKIWHARAIRPWQEIEPGVVLGRLLNDREAARLCDEQNIAAAIDLTAEHAAPEPLRRVAYLNLPVLDLTAPTMEQFQQAVEFIERHARSGAVYVFCGLGYSRSASIIAAHLLAGGRAGSVGAAWAMIRARRPEVVLKPDLARALGEFQRRHHRAPLETGLASETLKMP